MSAADLYAGFSPFQHDAARLALSWFLQSALLITLGLLAARILRRRGAAVQSVIYRATLAAMLLCPGVSWLLLGAGGTRAEEPFGATAANPSATGGDQPTAKKQPVKQGGESAEGKHPAKGTVFLSALGTVLDADGKPVAGAKVYLREWSSLRASENPYERNPRDVLATAQTAADGKFRFDKVPAAPFRAPAYKAPWDVVVVADGHGMAWRHLGSADDKTPTTLILPSEAKLTGRLVDTQGRPVAGVEVRLCAFAPLGSSVTGFLSPAGLNLSSSQLAPRVRTDTEGRFAIGGLPPEMRASLVAEHAQYAREGIYAATTDRPQPDLEGISYSPKGERQKTPLKVHTGDFTIQLKPGLQIRGRVVFADTKRPCPAAEVVLAFRSRAQFQIADAQGRFTFPGLSDRNWYVYASSPQQGNYLRRGAHVALREDQGEAELLIELPRGQVVTGSVLGEDTGKGVPGVHVAFWDQRPDDAPDRLYASPVTTDENGGFRIVVPPGKVSLSISGPVKGYDLPNNRIPMRGADPRFIHEIDVKPGEAPAEVRFTVGRGLILTGEVTDPEGKPVGGAKVRVLPAWPNRPKTQTDSEGRFTIAGLPRMSEVWLEARHRQRRLISRLRFDIVLTATPSQLATVYIRLEPGAAVWGRMLVDGQPEAGIRVVLVPKRAESYIVESEWVETDEAGRFEFDLVPPDKDYRIQSRRSDLFGVSSPTFSLEPGQARELPTFELHRSSKR